MKLDTKSISRKKFFFGKFPIYIYKIHEIDSIYQKKQLKNVKNVPDFKFFILFSESSFASYPGSISWLQEQHQQQLKDEVFEANNENVVRLDSRRRSANNDINRRKCC